MSSLHVNWKAWHAPVNIHSGSLHQHDYIIYFMNISAMCETPHSCQKLSQVSIKNAAVPRRKFRVINAYIKKIEKISNNLTLQLKELAQSSRKGGNNKNQSGNKVETPKTRKTKKTWAVFWINKQNWQAKKKRLRVINEKGDNTTDATKIHRA